jgi:hypothetical protein
MLLAVILLQNLLLTSCLNLTFLAFPQLSVHNNFLIGYSYNLSEIYS